MFRIHLKAIQPNKNNNMHPIKYAMFAWNHGSRTCRTPGFVGVCTHPDRGQLPKTDYWIAPLFDLPTDRPTKAQSDILFLKLKLMVEAWHMACRDEVPIENIHKAFSQIPEYLELLSEDFRVSSSSI